MLFHPEWDTDRSLDRNPEGSIEPRSWNNLEESAKTQENLPQLTGPRTKGTLLLLDQLQGAIGLLSA